MLICLQVMRICLQEMGFLRIVKSGILGCFCPLDTQADFKKYYSFISRPSKLYRFSILMLQRLQSQKSHTKSFAYCFSWMSCAVSIDPQWQGIVKYLGRFKHIHSKRCSKISFFVGTLRNSFHLFFKFLK